MGAMLPMLLSSMTSQRYTNSICDATMGHAGVSLGTQNVALLVLPSSNNQHDINWMKMELIMDEIIILTHLNCL